MAGRGRGRGRGRGANSKFGEWKTDTISDEQLLRPPFYPDIRWREGSSIPWTGDLSETLIRPKRLDITLRLIKKQRELRSRWTEADSYIRPSKPFDIMLDATSSNTTASKPNAPDAAFWKSLSATNEKLKNDPRYFPSELVYTHKRKRKASWSQFADAEDSGDSSDEGDKEEDALDNTEDVDNEKDDVPDDEDVGEDYCKNYYDSDIESEGGDDEPAF